MRNKNKIVQTFLLILILFAGNGTLMAQFAGGNGTERSPWLIETAEQLDMVRNKSVGTGTTYFKQIADIDLGVAPWNQGEGWEPINSTFTSAYDGGCYVIKNLYINRPESDNIGLFGNSKCEKISYVFIKDANIVGRDNVGGIVGYSSKVNVESCFSSGKIKGRSNVGGLVGFMEKSGGVTDCRSKASVLSTINTEANTGGLIGLIKNSIRLQHSYFRGKVEAEGKGSNNGGLVGKTEGGINRCYSTGEVKGGENTGALAGVADSRLVLNSYWDKETSGITQSAYGEPRRTADLTYPYSDVETYKGWDLTDKWRNDFKHKNNDGYPFQATKTLTPFPVINPKPTNGEWKVAIRPTFQWEFEYNEFQTNEPIGFFLNIGLYSNPPTDVVKELNVGNVLEYTLDFDLKFDERYYWQIKPYNDSGTLNDVPTWEFYVLGYGEHYFSGGRGDIYSPYIVETAEQLNMVRGLIPKTIYYLQTKDIDLGVPPWNEGKGWEPIGSSLSESFGGGYDGGGHKITGLYIEKEEDNVGLFGYTRRGEIRNINLVNANVTGANNVGGVVGYSSMKGTINNCHVSQSTVTGNDSVGGLVGRLADESMIELSSVKSFVSGNNSVGGLVGRVQQSVINNSYCRGDVRGKKQVGGLVGYNYLPEIKDAYSACSVFGLDDVGGFGGYLYDGGYNVVNSYWDTELSEQETSVFGEGRTTAEMTYPYGQNTYTGWNFEFIWAQDREHLINDGYPYLALEKPVSVEQTGVIEPTFINITNYPNPFNPETTISYNLQQDSQISLEIYNLKGQKIKSLCEGFEKNGEHRVVWDGTDNNGKMQTSGVYFYKLTTPQGSYIGKMMLLK